MPPQAKPKPQAQSKPKPRSWSPDVAISRNDRAFRVSIALPRVDPKDVRAQIKDGILTVQGHRTVLNLDLPPREVERTTENGLKRLFLEPVVDRDDFVCNIQLPATLDVQRFESLFERGSFNESPDQDEGSRLNITIAESADPTYRPDRSSFDEFMRAKGVSPPYEGDPFPIDIDTSKPANVDTPGSENHVERQMREQAEKSFVQNGIRYWPLALAAQMGQAPRQTVLNWIKNKTEFEGRPLQGYYLSPVDRYLVSEESIHRMANRFVKWPSQEPTGPVTMGSTKDKSGFVGMTEAAKIAGVSRRTMWLWASDPKKAPTDKPLDIIKCTTSDYFYIREKDAHDLKRLVPRSGLQRGRRPRLMLQP